jgi:hypothetical protein
MRVAIVYKYESDHARPVLDYDIVEYPTVVALDDSGGLQHMWRGLPLPTISEISYYF